MGWIKKKFEEGKREVKRELGRRKQLREVRSEALQKERVKEARVYAAKQAKAETAQKLKKFKQKSKGFEFKGFAGPTQKQPNMGLGVADYLTGSNKGKKKKRNNDMGLF